MFSQFVEDYLNKVSRDTFNAAQSKDSALALAVLVKIKTSVDYYIEQLEGKYVQR